MLEYSARWLSQLGDYRCPSCGFSRPDRDLWADMATALDGGAVQLHYIPTYVPITVFGVAGLAALSDGCLALVKRCGGPGHLLPAVDLLAAIVGICVVGWPMLAADAWTVEGRREVWLPPSERDTPFRLDYSAAFHRQVRELVDDLEPQSVVFTGWCTIYPYYYVAHVEKGRTDLEFFQDYPHRNHFQLADSALEYVREVCTQRPVYFTGVDKRVAETFRLKPVLRGRETLYRVVGPMAANRTTNEPRTVTAK